MVQSARRFDGGVAKIFEKSLDIRLVGCYNDTVQKDNNKKNFVLTMPQGCVWFIPSALSLGAHCVVRTEFVRIFCLYGGNDH